MKTIYIADFQYGKANLTKAKLVKETPEILIDAEPILGNQTLSPRGGCRFFLSEGVALVYLINQAAWHVKSCKREKGRATEEYDRAIQEYNRLCQIAEGGTEHD